MVHHTLPRDLDSQAKIQLIKDRLAETKKVYEDALSDPQSLKTIALIADEVTRALKNNGRVVVFGNGGSAADAQHFAAELVGGFTNHNRRAVDVVALSTNTSCLTAIGNDYIYDEVFSRQVEAHCKTGDVAIGITTSGNSKNVLLAMAKARSMGVKAIGLTGSGGTKLQQAAEITFMAPSKCTPRIQELHIAAIHAICELAEIALFGNESNHG